MRPGPRRPVSGMPFRLDRALIRVSGPDAVNFLDNLLTQNVAHLARARVQYAALLSRKARFRPTCCFGPSPTLW